MPIVGTGTAIEIKDLDGNVLRFSKRGYANGPRFDFTNGEVDLTTNTWGLKIPGTSTKPLTLTNTLIMTGTGTPESAVTAPVGSLFLRTNGGATTTLYVKTKGSGSTGWTAK
jgi:hypothetical protein